MSDFNIQDHGAFSLLDENTDAAKEWVKQNLPNDATRWGGSIVVAHSYSVGIIASIVGEGLTIDSENAVTPDPW